VSYVVTASDILAELDRVITTTREEARTAQASEKHDEAEFADNVQAGLTALREHLRSEDFLVQCRDAKEKKTP
jgi:negative regulator of replication initiation